MTVAQSDELSDMYTRALGQDLHAYHPCQFTFNLRNPLEPIARDEVHGTSGTVSAVTPPKGKEKMLSLGSFCVRITLRHYLKMLFQVVMGLKVIGTHSPISELPTRAYNCKANLVILAVSVLTNG